MLYVRQPAPDAAILDADGSHIQLLPLLRAMWRWAGQQLRVPTPGTNDTRMPVFAFEPGAGDLAPSQKSDRSQSFVCVHEGAAGYGGCILRRDDPGKSADLRRCRNVMLPFCYLLRTILPRHPTGLDDPARVS